MRAEPDAGAVGGGRVFAEREHTLTSDALPAPVHRTRFYSNGAWHDAGVFRRDEYTDHFPKIAYKSYGLNAVMAVLRFSGFTDGFLSMKGAAARATRKIVGSVTPAIIGWK